MADEQPGLIGVPRQDWLDTLRAVVRLDLMVTIAIALSALTLLALMRKGVLTAADLYPLATK